MSAAIDNIEAVQQTIENDRKNANAPFSQIFAQVQALAEKLNVEITSRRAGVRKQNLGSNAFEENAVAHHSSLRRQWNLESNIG